MGSPRLLEKLLALRLLLTPTACVPTQPQPPQLCTDSHGVGQHRPESPARRGVLTEWRGGLETYRMRLPMRSPAPHTRWRPRNSPFCRGEHGDHFPFRGPQCSHFPRAVQLCAPNPQSIVPASLPRLASWRLSRRHFQAGGGQTTGVYKMVGGNPGFPLSSFRCPCELLPGPRPSSGGGQGLSSTPRSPTSPAQPWPLEPAIHPMYSQENGCFPRTLGREVASDPRSRSSFFSPRSRDSPADGG